MSQEGNPDPMPGEFTFRPWNPREESWDAFIRTLERAYAQYVDCARHRMQADPTSQDPDADEPVP